LPHRLSVGRTDDVLRHAVAALQRQRGTSCQARATHLVLMVALTDQMPFGG
jgi:hypothetical protein